MPTRPSLPAVALLVGIVAAFLLVLPPSTAVASSNSSPDGTGLSALSHVNSSAETNVTATVPSSRLLTTGTSSPPSVTAVPAASPAASSPTSVRLRPDRTDADARAHRLLGEAVSLLHRFRQSGSADALRRAEIRARGALSRFRETSGDSHQTEAARTVLASVVNAPSGRASASALPGKAALSPPPQRSIWWTLVGTVFGVLLSAGTVLGYREYSGDANPDAEWIEVPLVQAGDSLDVQDAPDETFPMKTEALSQPITAEDVIAIDEGTSVRCVATLQVVRFFT